MLPRRGGKNAMKSQDNKNRAEPLGICPIDYLIIAMDEKWRDSWHSMTSFCRKEARENSSIAVRFRICTS